MSTSLLKEELTVLDARTPRELLPAFYQQYSLGPDGGQSSPYVRVEFTKKFAIYIPNFKARKKAVFKHDIHHLATGYPSTLKGETEISAWEIGSGCRRYWAAYLLDLHGLMMGIPFNPVGVFNAFVRGRRTKNLYSNQWSDEKVMSSTMGEIKRHLMLNEPGMRFRGKWRDMFLFLLVLVIGLVYSVLSIILLPFILVYTLYISLVYKT